MSLEQKKVSRIDYGQLFIVGILATIGLLAIYSAQQNTIYDKNFFKQQIVFLAIGLGIAFVVMQFDSDRLKKASWYLYGFGVATQAFLLVAPESIARKVNGAKAWFQFGGFSIQPAEFMKVFLIIMLANVIHRHHKKNENKTLKTDLLLLLKLVVITFIPFGLIFKEDLGSGLVILAILTGMMFVSGISWRILIPIFAAVALIVSVLMYLVLEHPEVLSKVGVEKYQLKRIYSWQDPFNYQTDASYQLRHSIQAIGSGEVIGKGFTEKEVYLPEAHSDFIFCVIGEEYGFLGGSIVIILYFMLIFTWTRIALETKNDYNSYLCIGVISLLTFHVFENIGMTIGMLPITGIPLPFISYGGSSLWGSMMALGLIFSVRYHHKVYMFAKDDE